jgi:hypothetical protein
MYEGLEPLRRNILTVIAITMGVSLLFFAFALVLDNPIRQLRESRQKRTFALIRDWAIVIEQNTLVAGSPTKANRSLRDALIRRSQRSPSAPPPERFVGNAAGNPCNRPGLRNPLCSCGQTI